MKNYKKICSQYFNSSNKNFKFKISKNFHKYFEIFDSSFFSI